MKAARKVKCPQCKKHVVYSTENPYRPFCSERCKLIDLGEWADEAYRIPDKSQNPPPNVDSEDSEGPFFH